MWISRKEYNFLKENAEKNINAECEILRAKEKQDKAVARAMEEYSATLEKLDEWKKCCTDNYKLYMQVLRTIKSSCETIDMIFNETIKAENGEESAVNKFDSIKSFVSYMKCFNDINMKFVKEKLGEDNTKK